MKIIYECEICGFRSQNKEEVQRCEAQGAKNKFSVGEEVEYRHIKQWERVKVQSVLFFEKTHRIKYVVGPNSKIFLWASQADEEELRPLSVEQRS